jgi:hypothetical protein
MANDKKFINKLTKGLKLKINKKKKSNWKNLNSGGIPRTPTDESMIYSDTEAELYQAKINVEANRSFSYHNNAYNNDSYTNTNNILAALNSSNDKFVNRSKTTYQRQTTNTYTYNSTITSYNNNLGRKPQTSQGNYNIYPSTTTESRKNSLQNVVASSQTTTNTQPIQIQYTSSSTNSAPYTSSSTTISPLSLDTSDTFINELNSNNPFKSDINLNANSIHPKATTSQINSQLGVPNTDMAMSHTLISPIEFDVSGNEIKSNNANVATTTESNSQKDVNQSNKEQRRPSRSKSIKKVKPLITFDKPPVVSPMTVDSEDEENTRGRKRGGRKSKKYSKKRSSPSLSVKTTELRDRSKSVPNFGKRSSLEGKLTSIKPSLVTSPTKKGNEEDDDIPLGIIQYKCISSILQESAPPNISSLQSNTKKSYKSSNVKDNYGYLSPTEHYPQENKSNKEEPTLKISGSLHRRSKSYHTGTHKKRTPVPLTPPLSPKRTEEEEDDENDNIPLYKLLDLDSHDGPMKTMVKPKNLPKLKQKKFRDALDTYKVNVNEDLDLDFDIGFNDIDNTNNNTTTNNNNNKNNSNYNNNNNISNYHVTSNMITSPKITITNPFESEFNSLTNNNTIVNTNTNNSNSPSFTTNKAIDIAVSHPYQSFNYVFSDDEDENQTNIFNSNMNMNSNQNNLNFINNKNINSNNFNNFNNINNNINNNNIFTNFNNSNNFNQFNFNQNSTKVNYNPFLELSNNNLNIDNYFRPYSL